MNKLDEVIGLAAPSMTGILIKRGDLDTEFVPQTEDNVIATRTMPP